MSKAILGNDLSILFAQILCLTDTSLVYNPTTKQGKCGIQCGVQSHHKSDMVVMKICCCASENHQQTAVKKQLSVFLAVPLRREGQLYRWPRH